jgi:CRISPR system Cascade subunit CasA
LYNPDGNKIWGKQKAIWEIPPRAEERKEIPQPDSQAALLTLQSRRLKLIREGQTVTGYYLMGGDYFPKEKCYVEQMTVWRNISKNKGNEQIYAPKRHNPSIQMWRDFAALVEQDDSRRSPGIVEWIKVIKPIINVNFNRYPLFRFQITGMKYGDSDYFIEDAINDSLSFNYNLLSNMHAGWIHRIINELRITEILVRVVSELAQCIAKASGIKDGKKTGGDDGISIRDDAVFNAYYKLDILFRNWLENIDPDNDDLDEKCNEWWIKSKNAITEYGGEMMKSCSPQALIGRAEISAAEAYNRFLYFTKNQENLKRRDWRRKK